MKAVALLILFFCSAVFAKGDLKKSGKTHVDFTSLKDQQEVKSPFKVKMKVTGMKIRPAGEDPSDKKSGHHHLLINQDSIPKGQPIPADANHIHFGKGQTETELNLAPGDYTLTLQFADGAHLSYGPEFSKTIHIKVTK